MSQIPQQSLPRIFLRFLKFGLLAWGGPVAQIDMIRKELVDDERWETNERFNRLLAVYQVLPGPEATELAVYFGMQAGGRLGGFLAGFAFILPGFLLMLLLSAVYVSIGIQSPLFHAAFLGIEAAVGALIVRAIHRIAMHAVANKYLILVALFAVLMEILGAHFLVTLLLAGVLYVLFKRTMAVETIGLAIALLVATYLVVHQQQPVATIPLDAFMPTAKTAAATNIALFRSGLRSGLLTFGGAYTVIPFLQHDAVQSFGWLTNKQFLDGLALSGIIPAPLIIFSTFVGFLAGGLTGAIIMTVAIFLPAFLFTFVGHKWIEKLVEQPHLHAFLEGVTAGVVSLMAVTTFNLLKESLTTISAGIIFLCALAVLYLWKSKAAVPLAVLGAGMVGLLLFR